MKCERCGTEMAGRGAGAAVYLAKDEKPIVCADCLNALDEAARVARLEAFQAGQPRPKKSSKGKDE